MNGQCSSSDTIQIMEDKKKELAIQSKMLVYTTINYSADSLAFYVNDMKPKAFPA